MSYEERPALVRHLEQYSPISPIGKKCNRFRFHCSPAVLNLSRHASCTELRRREEAKTECLGQKPFEKAVILQDTSKKSYAFSRDALQCDAFSHGLFYRDASSRDALQRDTFSRVPLSVMPFRVMSFSVMPFSVMHFSVMPFSVMPVYAMTICRIGLLPFSF